MTAAAILILPGTSVAHIAGEGESAAPEAVYSLSKQSGQSFAALEAPVELDLADDSGVNLPLPFNFCFFGVDESALGVTSEGYLTFGGGVRNRPIPLPSPTTPNGVLAPFWDELRPVPGLSRVRTATIGRTPQRAFVVEWRDFALSDDLGARLTFRALLYEGSMRIEFHYLELRNGNGAEGVGRAAGSLASIGLEDRTGTKGFSVGDSLSTLPLRGGDSLSFDLQPESPARLVVSPGVAQAGSEVDLPVRLLGNVIGLRGLQGRLRITASDPEAPALYVRAIPAVSRPSEDRARVEPSLPGQDPLDFVLPVGLLDTKGRVRIDDAPAQVATLRLVIPEDAPQGTVYTLQIEEALLAGDDHDHTLDVSVPPATLTVIGPNGPSVPFDQLSIQAPSVVETGEATVVSVLATSGGYPSPGISVQLFLTNPAFALDQFTATTDADGFARFSLTTNEVAATRVLALADGADPAERFLTAREPVLPEITSEPPLSAAVGQLYAYSLSTTPTDLELTLTGPPGMTLQQGD
ncbi:MAG TPA: hypothetical protein DEA08_08600, partial [Planctomycetes bacterium]|nr:hypothetical protein [Planctomycetota bacterium]